MEWRPVEYMDGLYEVSNTGIVRRTATQRVLKSFPNRKGYPNVVMHKHNQAYSKTVHRLVAEAFLDNPLGLEQVNHKDANKTNNCVENLEWISNLDNMHHAMAHGCYKPFNENQLAAVKKNLQVAVASRKKAVVCMDMDGNIIAEYDSLTDAERATGCNNAKICACCKGRRHKTGGMQWKYKEDQE